MKKIFIFLTIILLFFVCFNLISTTSATAATSTDPSFQLELDPDGSIKSTTGLTSTDPASIAYYVVDSALRFLGFISTILIIIAGFMWLFAMGNEEKIKKAEDLLKGAFLGLLVIMASYGMAQYVFEKIILSTIEK